MSSSLVSLGDSVNVRLMDRSNFASYKAGRRHRYIGGHVSRSPYRLTVPTRRPLDSRDRQGRLSRQFKGFGAC